MSVWAAFACGFVSGAVFSIVAAVILATVIIKYMED